MASNERDIYSFFESFKDYKLYEKEMEEKFTRDSGKTTCDSFAYNDRKFGSESANIACVKFKMLYTIIEQNRLRKSKFVDDKDFAYLNYWLNVLSRKSTSSNSVTLNEFQSQMSSIEGIFTTVTFDRKLFDIKDEDYNNMILLSDIDDHHSQIYQNTSKMGEEIKPCLQYFQEYINTYKKGIIQCPHDNTSFCRALNHFKKKYEEKFFGQYGTAEGCSDKELLKLPTYKNVSIEDKITVVGTILGPTLGTLLASVFLYRLTPFGKWIHSKLETKKGAHNNLYEINDELLLDNSDSSYMYSRENPYRLSFESITHY
ncbi:PIR Superfamily Protein [Plasmodium ovale wallikeri]|uniref:PIR Superfamily Protein n=1 Tax=Plasmodium ovale wallikeri TaxID=864142 RepID=A0A1A9AGD5_PLAOA|nr:PIR Superfamily Protein [Plasmodium ovale wallikeri]SBT56320.1 PIR Superfamily Protein [Plasmodium ovale wallikeri]